MLPEVFYRFSPERGKGNGIKDQRIGGKRSGTDAPDLE
ncbi:MAG: hypothetical protein RHS_4809 [Robinsoniella sp. RHS]|nr:MAG: hypothetical protein RHS_4809 [Robinsoniella sp. RHS]